MPAQSMNPDRFWVKVARLTEPGACWLWLASVRRDGYGQIGWGGRTRAAHQVSYEMLVGPIPAGTELDHLCRVPTCVNPAHLEAVSHRENVRRGTAGQPRGAQMRALEQCIRGHRFDDQNTAITPQGWRKCRACGRLHSAAFRARAAA